MVKSIKKREDDIFVSHEACSRMRTSSSRWILGIIGMACVLAVGWGFVHSVSMGETISKIQTTQKVLEVKDDNLKEDVQEIKTIVKEIREKM